MKKLNDYQVIELVEKYKSEKYNMSELAKYYKVTLPAITGLLKRRNVKIRNNQSSLQRKYTLNQNYFNTINTEDKAYFLGLLYADGYNNESRNCVVLSLKEDDLEILEKFNKCLDSNRPIKAVTYKNENVKLQYRLSISSKQISQDLKDKGCGQAKTFDIKFPDTDILPKNLKKHFIRGYFDGDGWVGKQSSCIVGTQLFCESLKDILKDELNINSYIRTRHKERNHNIRMHEISGGRQLRKFMKWLYDDCNFYMRRKYEKCLEYNHFKD
jgi:predicted HTH domain antitoxin